MWRTYHHESRTRQCSLTLSSQSFDAPISHVWHNSLRALTYFPIYSDTLPSYVWHDSLPLSRGSQIHNLKVFAVYHTTSTDWIKHTFQMLLANCSSSTIVRIKSIASPSGDKHKYQTSKSCRARESNCKYSNKVACCLDDWGSYFDKKAILLTFFAKKVWPAVAKQVYSFNYLLLLFFCSKKK